MKGPPRLIHDDPEFARFVAASNNEEPAGEQLERALSLATKTAAATRWSSFRWLGPGIAVGAAIIGASVVGILSTTGAPARGEAAAPVIVAPVSTPVGVAESPLEPSVTTVSVNDLAAPSPAVGASERPDAVRTAAPAAAPRRRGQDGVSGPSAPRAPAGQTTFSEELALVSAARSALEAGDVRACLREVDRYDERFHAGVFAHEIEVIRIEALASAGERARAKALAERFLAGNPNSPYADLVRSLIDRSRD